MTARTTTCKIGDVNAYTIAHNIRENGQSPVAGFSPRSLLLCLREFVVERGEKCGLKLPAEIVRLHLRGKLILRGAALDRIGSALHQGIELCSKCLNIRAGFGLAASGNCLFEIEAEHAVK